MKAVCSYMGIVVSEDQWTAIEAVIVATVAIATEAFEPRAPIEAMPRAIAPRVAIEQPVSSAIVVSDDAAGLLEAARQEIARLKIRLTKRTRKNRTMYNAFRAEKQRHTTTRKQMVKVRRKIKN